MNIIYVADLYTGTTGNNIKIGGIEASVLKMNNTESCGELCNWGIYDDLLYISGSGPMNNYDMKNNAPWYKFKSSIKNIVIE